MRLARIQMESETAFAVLEGDVYKLIQGDLFAPLQFDGRTCRRTQARLLAPVLPSKVVCVGKNYSDHAAEMGSAPPEEPLLFLKPSTSVIGPEDVIEYPADCTRLDYEAELAVVIKSRCKDVPLGAYQDVVLGYTCLNDVTARDLQAADGQWTRSKGFDTFCPIGPWIETELDPSDVLVQSRLNGRVCQAARTSLLIHDVDKLVYYASRIMTLLPGDVIATGTPAGIGPMQCGDRVQIEVEGIGVLENVISLHRRGG